MQKEVTDFLDANKSLNKIVNEKMKGGTDLKKNLSSPEISKGLKVENGGVVPDEAIIVAQNKVDLLMDAKSKVLPEVNKYTPKTSKEAFRQKAIEEIKSEGLLEADQAEIINRLDRQLDAMPDQLDVVALDEIRAKARKSSRNAKGTQKPANEYAAIENAARDSVFEATDNLLSQNKGEFAALNSEIKGWIDTINFLDKNVRGSKVKGGRAGILTGRLAGAVAGTPGGVIGSVLGSEVGGTVANIVMNNNLGSSLKMKLIRNMVDDPALLKQIESIVSDVQSYQPKQIGASTTGIRTVRPSGEVIELPKKSPSSIEAEEIQRLTRQKDQSMPTSNATKNSIKESVTKSSVSKTKSKVKAAN